MLAPVLSARRRSPAPALAHCRCAGRITDPVCVTQQVGRRGLCWPTGLEPVPKPGSGGPGSSPQALRVALACSPQAVALACTGSSSRSVLLRLAPLWPYEYS